MPGGSWAAARPRGYPLCHAAGTEGSHRTGQGGWETEVSACVRRVRAWPGRAHAGHSAGLGCAVSEGLQEPSVVARSRRTQQRVWQWSPHGTVSPSQGCSGSSFRGMDRRGSVLSASPQETARLTHFVYESSVRLYIILVILIKLYYVI